MASLRLLPRSFLLGLAALVWAVPTGPANASRPKIDTTGMAAIEIDVQNASVASVIRSFQEFSGRNIIAGPEVTGTITAKLEGVPWLVALDNVMRAHGFGWEETPEGIIRISTFDKLQTERLNEAMSERKQDEFIPLETTVVPVSYAKADEMKKPLQILLSQRGKIETDERTNSLIVSDIPFRVSSVREMAHSLDAKTPQVEINARLVDVDARSIRDLGITWNTVGLNEGDAAVDLSVEAGLADQVGIVDLAVTGTDADFFATLDLLARQDKAEIISNPRITTADNKEAKIIVGKKIPLVVSDEAGNAITQLTTVGIKLTVVPHINQDGRVTLDLNPEVSDLSAQATVQGGIVIVTSEASTRVIVQDGQTAVIGGLIRTNESNVERGVPVLMDIPVLGNFFKSSNKVKEERELLIFVTPKILRPEEA